MVTYSQLTQCDNPQIDYDHVLDLEAVHVGGKKLEDRLSRFLQKSNQDDNNSYQFKLRTALFQHINYVQTSVNYYKSFLFSHPFQIRSVDGYADPFYAEFYEDCTGTGKSLLDLCYQGFGDGLEQGKFFIVPETPKLATKPKNRAEYDEIGAGRITTRLFCAQDLQDFEKDDRGELVWILFRDQKLVRSSITAPRDTIQETFWLYESANLTVYQISYDKNRPPNPNDSVPVIESAPHGFPFMPVIEVCLKGGLHLVEQLFKPQIANLKARFERAWLASIQANAIPVINSKSEDVSKAFGRGNALVLGSEDKYGWNNAPTEAFPHLDSQVNDTRTELFRAANLRFLGDADGNSMPWRSGTARMLDQDAGHTTIRAYGRIIKEAIEKLYQLISLVRNDDLKWSAEGFEHLEDYSFQDLVNEGEILGYTRIPSKTAAQIFYKRLARAANPDLDESILTTIDQEIDSADPESLIVAPAISAPAQIQNIDH